MKDPYSGVVVNTDQKAYERYVAERNLRLSQRKGLEQCFKEIDSIKGDISEIKELLLRIAQK